MVEYIFIGLTFLIPVIFLPFTSELFEFNKSILIYIATLLISCIWICKIITSKKIIFRRTILDLPLLTLLLSATLSTIISIDTKTSLLGYYSRGSGGLLLLICYALLYWAFVTFIDRKGALKVVRISLVSASLVVFYGFLQHFGVDSKLWDQDVRLRVFSTFGQPNLLAAWLVSMSPLIWWIHYINLKNRKGVIYLIFSLLLYSVILFTKSRSGLIAYFITFATFWFGAVAISKTGKRIITSAVLPLIFCISIISLLISNEPISVKGLNSKAFTSASSVHEASGELRKYLWQGAIKAWLDKPISGWGMETFAFVYPLYRPKEHNLTPEWQYSYDKAHNEYLNILSTTGLLGLGSYLFFVLQSIRQFKVAIGNKKSKSNIHSDEIKLLVFSVSVGFIGILITNFLGFPSVPLSLAFFIFPGIAFTITKNDKVKNIKFIYLSVKQYILVGLTFILCFFAISAIIQYYRADVLFTQGSTTSLKKAVNLNSKEPLYRSILALSYLKSGNLKNAIIEDGIAKQLAPNDIKITLNSVALYMNLVLIDSSYNNQLLTILDKASFQSPTDPKIYYDYAIVFAKADDMTNANKYLAKAIELKPDYIEALKLKDLFATSKSPD